MKNLRIEPPFYHRQFNNDINTTEKKSNEEDNDLIHTGKRVTLVALPFLSLYKPFNFPLSFTLGGLRSIRSFSQLLEKFQEGEIKKFVYAFFQTILATIALGTVLFAHPLGMLLTSIHDCALNCLNMGSFLYQGELLSALGSYAHLMNNTLYCALLVYGGLELALASLAMQVFIGFGLSFSEYRKGNLLEAGGHFLMGMIRGKQLQNQAQLLQKTWGLKQVLKSHDTKGKERVKLPTSGNFFHTIAYYLQKPVQLTTEFFLRAICTPIRPGIEGNYASPTVEKAHRCVTVCLSVLFAPLTISLYALGEGMHFCGNMINRLPFTYLPGNGSVKVDDQNIKCMTLNACMLWGGLPIPLGGLRPPRERMEQLQKLIKEQNPDILFLQEMSFSPSLKLWDSLKNNYAYGLTRFGPNFLRMESGLAVFSKIPIEGVKFFPFPNQNGINRGCVGIQTPSKYFITTHLEAGNAAQERKKQLDMIIRHIEEVKNKKKLDCFILGDLNINSFGSNNEYRQSIGSYPSLFDPRSKENKGTESCTNVLVNHMLGKEVYSNLSEMDDYALFYGGPNQLDLKTKLIETYSTEDPAQAISDHKAYVLEINQK